MTEPNDIDELQEDADHAQAKTLRTDFRISRADAMALYAIIDELRKVPHLNRRLEKLESACSVTPGTSCVPWAVVLNELIELVRAENNLDALWVWSRFLWAFGKRDTWEAARNFDGLLDLVRFVRESIQRVQRLKWYQWRERRSELKHVIKLYKNIGSCLAALHQNDLNWSDLEGYRAHEGKGR